MFHIRLSRWQIGSGKRIKRVLNSYGRGTLPTLIEKYPEKTSLQRQAKRYLESGGMLGTGIGVSC